MKYLPSPQVQAELIKAGLEQFCNGIDFEDADWNSQRDYFRSHPIHAKESDAEIDDRTGYFLIWRDYGVPQTGKSAEDVTAKRITVMHESLREMAREHFPKMAEDLAAVKESASIQANAGKMLGAQFSQYSDSIVTAGARNLLAIRAVQSAVSANASEARVGLDEVKTTVRDSLTHVAKIIGWGLGAIFALLLALVVMTAFSLRAHAQGGIDGVTIQQGGVNVGNPVSGGYLKLNFASGCTVTAGAGPIRNVTCTGAAGNPGGSATQVQYNNAGTSFSGISTMTTDGTIVTAKVGTNWLFVDPSDATKKVQFDASGISTTTTRTVAFPDANSRTIKNGTTTGQIPIWNAGTSTFDVSDPLVQGTQAAGSTTIPNPVVIGGSDYGGTAAVQTAKVTSAGALQTHETGTAAISAASLPLPTGAALDSSLTTLDTDVKSNITLHAGTNVIGHVIADSGSTTAVTGNVTAVQATGSNLHVAVDSAPSTAVTNAGTFAVQAATTIADGADTTLGAKGDAKSTATDTTAVSAISVLKEISAMEQAPASRAVTNAGTFAVQAAQSGTWTVQPGNTANTTAWKVDGSAVTQPVSGTVTANAGTNLNTSALALDATLTGGTAKDIVRGGAKGTTSAADVTSSASGVNHQPIDVAIYDASGNQITTFGGGTQYAEGTTVATATGTVLLGKNASNVVSSAQLDVSNNLNVNCQAGCTSVSASATFVAGQLAVTGASQPLPSNVGKSVCVHAATTNGFSVFVGASGVTIQSGAELGPGDSRCWPVANANLISVIGAATGASIDYTVTN
jgi:hypothetical protein